ncbi:MAG: G1 family glutamic endopeptidase [Acidimicrobiales bacterium]
MNTPVAAGARHSSQGVQATLSRYATGTEPNMAASLARPTAVGGVSATSSFNWSGYATVSSTKRFFTRVSASWTVPKVTCTTEDRLAAVWVGLDGFSDKTVEQDGTTSQCYEGKPVYYSWYEMYPAGSVAVGKTVKPGDKITASVVRTGTSYAIKVTDATTAGNNISLSETCSSCLDTSAEWIIERPAYSVGVAPLAVFNSVTVSNAAVVGGSKHGTIGTFTAYRISMIDATQAYYLATMSGLNKAGNLFTATWKNSW